MIEHANWLVSLYECLCACVVVDVRKAGEGQLEIMVNNGTIPNTVQSDESGVYKMSFIPEDGGEQKVEIIFNQEQHPGMCIVYVLTKNPSLFCMPLSLQTMLWEYKV